MNRTRRYTMKAIVGILVVMIFGLVGTVHANLDEFDGKELKDIWTYRDPRSNGEYEFKGGKMILHLKRGSDMYTQGADGGVMFLMDPPDMDSFTVEMKLNAAVNGSQPPACHVGIVFFNEAEWSYSIWGPYEAGSAPTRIKHDIRLEDCIGKAYRWRDQSGIGVDVTDVAIDQDVWLKVVKDSSEMEFFAKGDANGKWVSGGVDTKLVPRYMPGDYQIGIIAKSYPGLARSTFEIEFFDVPALAAAVEPGGKLMATWGSIRSKL
jgi:hypothetical protein